MDRVTREAIDERLKVLEGVSVSVNRAIDDLMRMRSVLPVPASIHEEQVPSTSRAGREEGSSSEASSSTLEASSSSLSEAPSSPLSLHVPEVPEPVVETEQAETVDKGKGKETETGSEVV